MIYTVVFHPEAEQDFIDAYLWYEERSTGLGERFSKIVENQVNLIANDPEHYPKKRGQYRESKTEIFPYLIVYKVYPKTEVVLIVAVYHTRRRPGKKYRK